MTVKLLYKFKLFNVDSLTISSNRLTSLSWHGTDLPSTLCWYLLVLQASSSVESEHTQVVNRLNLQVSELEEKRKKEEERREDLSREVQRLKREADERQKILEEAELLRAELARIKQEAVIRAGKIGFSFF